MQFALPEVVPDRQTFLRIQVVLGSGFWEAWGMAMKDEDSQRGERLRDQAGWEARREVNLRIVIQNTVLCLHTSIITVLLVAQVLSGQSPWLFWLIGIMSSTVLGQIWLHNGIRHVQIRRYFEDVLDVETGNHFESWEDFLKRMHPRSPLGTRWWVSTKAIFAFTQLGFGLVALLNALQTDASPGPGLGLIVMGAIFGVITIALLGHPPLPTNDSGDGSPKTTDSEQTELER